ncbi:MAG: CDP-glucose 4,6-dehydratase [Chitinophagales bacterium]
MFGGVFTNKKVLITGISGFKGSWLALWLNKLNASLAGISLSQSAFNNLDSFGIKTHVDLREFDLTDLSLTRKAIEEIKPDFIFHIAAQPLVTQAFKEPSVTIHNNINSTVNLLEALRLSSHATTAVFITTDKVYENREWYYGYRETDHLGGKDVYSASKASCELLISAYHRSYFGEEGRVKICTVRAGNVIGGGDWLNSRIIPDCVNAWHNAKTVELRNPDASRPWQFVLDPLSGYLRTAQLLAEGKSIVGESFNFGPDASLVKTVKEVVSDLARNFSERPLQELIDEKVSNTKYEAGMLKLNTDKALQLLNWQPVIQYDEAMKMIGSWYKMYFNTPEKTGAFTSAQLEDYISLARNRKAVWV